jgi:multiple sugar transport system permease protein
VKRHATPGPRGERAALLGMLAPWLTGVALLTALPALLACAIAFTRYDALSPPAFAGLANFAELGRHPLFWTAVRNSAAFVLLAVPLRLLAALLLALALKPQRPRAGLTRLLVFFPAGIPDVAYALLWLWIFNPAYGPLNLALQSLGLPAPAWLADPRTALLALVIMAVFQTGEGFLVLLAGLQSIPEAYYQHAALEGSSRWWSFRTITLPLLAPWLLLLTARDIVVTAQGTFTPALLMTGGGPYYATFFVPLLVYEEAFTEMRFGAAAAIMLLMLLGAALLIGLVFLALRGWGHRDEI